MSAEEEAERYVRHGVPSFVQVYDDLRTLMAKRGLEPGRELPGEVSLGQELGVPRELVREALLLLSEDGYLTRTRSRGWAVAEPVRAPVRFTDSFHRMLSGGVRPVRRLHVSLEDGSSWSHELLRTEGPMLAWETVFARDDVLLASSLELMVLDAVPAELREELDPEKHDPVARPTLLEALGPERRAGLTAEVWRLAAVSRSTERLSWMELPLHGNPAVLTVLLAEAGRPVYLAKNVFDLGTFDVVVDQLAPR